MQLLQPMHKAEDQNQGWRGCLFVCSSLLVGGLSYARDEPKKVYCSLGRHKCLGIHQKSNHAGIMRYRAGCTIGGFRNGSARQLSHWALASVSRDGRHFGAHDWGRASLLYAACFRHARPIKSRRLVKLLPLGSGFRSRLAGCGGC